jgi:aspartate racemase
LEIWGSLLNGARLVIFSPHTPSLEELGQVIQQYQITTLWLTAGLFHLMVDERLEDLKPLRQLLAGGDVLSVPHVQKFLQKIGDCKLINGYGPTENTTFTCCYPITEPDQLGNSVPIGRPITNTQVYLLDSHLQPVPLGVPGELYIGGDGLARGYLNRPDLTSEKFIPNPFPRSKGAGDTGSKGAKEEQSSNPERLYKTGDLARYLPDGNIEFLGRIDNQVKIRGFRIELGEVESTLSQYPAVRQCAVIARIDTDSDKRLVAYIVADQQQKPTTDELRRFLKQKLPDYMVPSAFVFPDALPLTPNGKIDRRALPAPDRLKLEQASTFVPPSDDLEIQLTKIWENVLGKKPISVKDNFFEVGGHSLLAVRLLAQIEKTFGKNLPLATLFQLPTVEQLAKILHQSGWSSPWFSLVPIQPSGSQPPFFGIHSLGKGQEHYRNIARHLGSDQPIYGLDYWLATRTKDTKELPKTWSVEELAAHYIKEMQILQPEGPYFLAGLSFAGIVAYEMAQQLVTQDQKVALLVLFDTYCPTLSVNSLDFNSLQIHLRNLSQLEMKEKLAYIMMKVKYKIEHYLKWIKPFFRKVAEKFYLKFKLPMPYALHYSLIVEANQKLGSDYALQVYPGKVTLFRASDQAVRYDQISDLGWSALALGGVEIHEVPGDHLGMFQEPHVQVLAEKLKTCIDRVQADDLAHIPSLCSDPFVCDNEEPEG